MRNLVKYLICGLVATVLSSCGFYRQNIMFQVDEDHNYDTLGVVLKDLSNNYLIKPNDKVSVQVYTGNGEVLIDPEQKLISPQNTSLQVEDPEYLVSSKGEVILPLVGRVNILDHTILQVDSVLSKEYNAFYENCFVLTKCVNRRVIVLGAQGGKVVPLLNENMSILEVLAEVGGVDNNAKVQNIRLIRGDLNNPIVQVIDLSTIAGMRRASLEVQSGDVIYVEPVRRVISESIRDISPIVGVLTSVVTLIFLISTSRRNQ